MGNEGDAPFATMQLPAAYNYLVPDKSEIRLLPEIRGGLARGTLPPHRVSVAVTHKTVEEIWYFLDGKGEV